MHRIVRGLLLASVIPFLAGPALLITDIPAQAQPADISFDAFHDQLSAYGDWLYSDRWGEVWRPYRQDQNPGWRPYAVGHWVYTSEYGWTWITDDGRWGDIVYHYGRWVYDPDDGWLWLAGYVWSPAWVVWRSAGPDVGWMPMPPDDDFLAGFGFSAGVSFGSWEDIGAYFGYARWYGPRFAEGRFGMLWTFVSAAHVADPAYRDYAVPQPQVVNIIRISRNVTNYTVINNVIVNRSVNVIAIQQAGGRLEAPVHAAAVLRTTRWLTPVSKGQQVQDEMRRTHPRGNGVANSAPQPTMQQIKGLSTRPQHVPAAGLPRHLFGQAEAAQILAGRPGANPALPGQARRGANPSLAGPSENPIPRKDVPGEIPRPQFNHPPGHFPGSVSDNMRPIQEQSGANPPRAQRPHPAEVHQSRAVPKEQVSHPPARTARPRPMPQPQAHHEQHRPEQHGERNQSRSQ